MRKVTELTGEFAGVYYDGMFGYVLRDYLASSPPYMGEDDLREDPGYYLGEMYVANCEEWISLYDDADTTSARLARIPLGTRLSAYQVDTRFAIVDYNDIIGFVLLEYLSMDPPSTTIWQESTTDPQYGPWSDWGDKSVQSSASCQVETRTVYGYYYYSCPSCGNHVHVYDCGDPEWCGGCGYSGSLESGWSYVFTETYYDTTILPQLSRIGTAPAAISMTTPNMEGSLPGSTVVTPRRMVKHSIGIGMFCEKPL